MATSLSFYLKRTTVYLQYSCHDGRVQVSTGLRVNVDLFQKNKLPKDQTAVIRRLGTLVDNYEVDMRQAGRPTRTEDVKALVLEETNQKPRAKPVIASLTFFQLFERYIKEVEAGQILNDGKKYSTSFIKVANVVKNRLQKSPLANENPATVTEDHMKAFVAEQTKSGLAKNSVASYMDSILSVYNGSRRLGWHKGAILETKAFSAKREDIDHAVYLTHEEQQKILDHKYEGKEALWRDAFILGCRLGMRHSDLYRLTPAHRNGDVVNINTTKTTTAVWVPLDAVAKEIWDRHAGVFTIPQLTPFMEFAKTLGEDAKLTKQVLFTRTEGGMKVERWVPKHSLLGTHTMRRSFATNAFKAGVPMISIMKVTGHRSSANFMKYIRLSDEEHANLLLAHPHFM